jgi:hypothetical protein
MFPPGDVTPETLRWMCIVAHCQKTRVGQVIDENIVGGTVAKACLQNEADAWVQRFIVSSRNRAPHQEVFREDCDCEQNCSIHGADAAVAFNQRGIFNPPAQ